MLFLPVSYDEGRCALVIGSSSSSSHWHFFPSSHFTCHCHLPFCFNSPHPPPPSLFAIFVLGCFCAYAIFCSFQSSVYLGFKRIPDQKEIRHEDFLSYIKPGNAAIILTTRGETAINEEGTPGAAMGHYTCAWKESEGEAYHYFDSEEAKIHYCVPGVSTALPYQLSNQKRVLFVFNLPLDPSQRRNAITKALANTMARLNGILQHCLFSNEFNSDADVSLPVNFFENDLEH